MKKKIKILYLGFNRSYTNPTAELILRIFGRIAHLDYYGPGFSDEISLSKGIEKWFNEQPTEYDFIVVDSYILECENIVKRKKPFLGDFLRFEPHLFAKYSLSYQKFFLQHQGRKIFISNWDVYNISEANIAKLLDSDTFVLEGGISTTNPKELIEQEYGKPFELGNDNWYHYVKNHKEKIISFPHLISDNEFDFSPLYARPYAFNVIGAPYDERKDAKRLLTPSQKRNDFKELIKLKIKQRSIRSMSELYLNQLRTKYLGEISRSKLCFCSGSPWLYPVRKYFEIPARGSVAIGWKCTGFENLGFIHGVNFIVAPTNDKIIEVLQQADDNELQTIAINGRSLIWDQHSNVARAEQLSESLQRITEGTFKGSFWKVGQYLHF